MCPDGQLGEREASISSAAKSARFISFPPIVAHASFPPKATTVPSRLFRRRATLNA
jgi:hypothetical protein